MAPTHHHPSKGYVTARGPVAAFVEARGFTPVIDAGQASELKGKALDDALTAANLSKAGVVAEKQARLAEYVAAQLDPTTDTDEVDDPTDPDQD